MVDQPMVFGFRIRDAGASLLSPNARRDHNVVQRLIGIHPCAVKIAILVYSDVAQKELVFLMSIRIGQMEVGKAARPVLGRVNNSSGGHGTRARPVHSKIALYTW